MTPVPGPPAGAFAVPAHTDPDRRPHPDDAPAPDAADLAPPDVEAPAPEAPAPGAPASDASAPGAPAPDSPAPDASASEAVRAGRWAGLPRWALLAVLLVLGALPRAWSLYLSPRPTTREAALVTQVVEMARYGLLGALDTGDVPMHLASLATPQLAALGTVTGAWQRAPSALGAVRESGVTLWLGIGVLTFLLARRCGQRHGWALFAVALLAICPAAISSARLVTPENVAALWAMGALVLVSWRRTGRAQLWLDLAAAACVSVAVLCAPLAVALVPSVLLCLRHPDRPRDPWRIPLVGGSALFATGLGAAVALVSAAPPTVATTVPGLHSGWWSPGWLGVDPVTPAVALVCALLALRTPADRPLGVGVLLPLPLALLMGAPPAALIAPLIAVLAAGTAQAWTGCRTWPATRRWVLPVGLTAVFALAWTVNYARLPNALAPPPTAQAAQWVRSHVPAGEQVLTDRRTRVALAPGTAQWNQVTSLDACLRRSSLLTSTPPPECVRSGLWVVDPSVHSGLPRHSTTVTAFGAPDRSDRIEVLRAEPDAHESREIRETHR